MRAESQVSRHRWWHDWFVRDMGAWQKALTDSESGAPIYIISRGVRYCRICREMFYHGTPIDEQFQAFLSDMPHIRLLEPGGSRCKVLPMRQGLTPVPRDE